jgi:TolA-binding protein
LAVKYRLFASVPLMLIAIFTALAQPPAAPPPNSAGASNGEIPLVERLIWVRREYQKSLEQLRNYYNHASDNEKTKWAEEELKEWHLISKYAFVKDLEMPPPNLEGNTNVPEANKLFTRAMETKDHGWGTDYKANQRRAEILFQELITKYPHSNKISDASYMLGDIYESKAYLQHRRAAWYYERCYQWNPKTFHDARIREARIYDKKLHERAKAIELYNTIITHDVHPERVTEAKKRVAELNGQR